MTTTTFGFDPAQDRIWMRVHDVDQTVWLTRRMVAGILGPMVSAFEKATPGEQGGAAAPARAAIEHELALHEAPPGQAAPQIRAGHVAPSVDGDPQHRLCIRMNAQTGAQTVVMTFETASGPLVVTLSRKGMHLWLKGLSLVLKHANWGLPQSLPQWLNEGLMPPAMKALIAKPLPDDLDSEAEPGDSAR